MFVKQRGFVKSQPFTSNQIWEASELLSYYEVSEDWLGKNYSQRKTDSLFNSAIDQTLFAKSIKTNRENGAKG